MTPIPEEAYLIREMMSATTGVRYDVEAALPEFPPPSHHAAWYLLGSEFRGPKGTAHAHTLWKDDEGNLFIESMYIGNTTEWIGPAYGEAGIIKGLKIDYSDFDRARKILAEMFPLVERRLDRYESILTDASSEHQVDLRLRCAGDKGGATFFIVAKIEGKGLTAEKAETIKQNVEALKAAWNDIAQYNRAEGNRR